MTGRREYRGVRRGIAGMYFGEHWFKDPMHGTDADNYEITLETMIDGTGLDILAIGGAPLVRGLGTTLGAEAAYLNTQTAGGLDAGTNAGGSFNDDAGVVPLLWEDTGRRVNGNPIITLWVPSLTTAPVADDVLTQLVSLATMRVTSADIVDNRITGEDLGTGTWITTQTFTSDNAGAVMAPTPITPRTVDPRDTEIGNVDSGTVTLADNTTSAELIVVGIRGYFETLVQGDDAGTGYNGDISAADSENNLTYNDDVRAYCAANYHTGAGTGPDNVYAFAMEAAGDNTPHAPEIITAFHRHDRPNIYVSILQGTNAQGDPQ